jgi:hypothetical protein
MASDKRDPVFFQVGTSTVFFKLNLDTDLYSTNVLAKTGGSTTAPADTAVQIPINKRYAIASGEVVEKIAKCERTGTGGVILTRRVPLLVEKAKLATIETLKGDTIQLGQGATTTPWTVKDVV